MNFGCKIKKDIGKQLGMLRLERQKCLFDVAQETKINIQTLDKMETGQNIGWQKYMILLNYYNCKIGIISK